MSLERIISLLFLCALLAGVATVLSYFFNTDFVFTFALCVGLFVFCTFVVIGLMKLFSK